MEEHQKEHTMKEYVCGNCDFTTENKQKIKEHIKNTHAEKGDRKSHIEEPEAMEIETEEVNEKMEVGSERDSLDDNIEEQERKKRSEIQDKKVIENQRKRDKEEQRLRIEKQEAEKKKNDSEKEKQQEEKLERKKRKASIKQQKKKIKRKLNKYPPNVTELPENVRHLFNEGDLQLQGPPDGACGLRSQRRCSSSV